MRLKIIRNVRLPVPDYRSCKQHAARFAADHAGSYHVISYCKIIFRREISLNHLTHLLITCHHDIAHSRALFGNIDLTLVKDLSAVKEPVPRVRKLLFGRALRLA